MKIPLKIRDRAILVFILTATAFALWQIPSIHVDGSSDVFIPAHHRVREINDRIEKEFGSMDTIVLAIQVNFGSVLEPDILSLVKKMTDELAALPESDRVISLTNADYIDSSPEGMAVVPLLEDLTDKGIGLMKERLADWSDVYVGSLISKDSKLAVIAIQPVREGRTRAIQVLYDKIRELSSRYKSANISFPVAGLPVVKEEISNSILYDLVFLIPLAVGLTVLILFLSFRRWEGVLYPLISLAAACLWTMGLMGLLNITFTMASMLVPVLLLVVGSAYGIHLMSHFYGEIAQRSGYLSAEEVRGILKKGIGNIRLSIILAGATTAGGFISQLSSPLGPFRTFGVLSAYGVLCTQATTFLVIPLLLRFQFRRGIDADRFTAGRKRPGKGKSLSVFPLFAKIVRHRKGSVILVSAALIIATAVVLPHINVGINLIHFFRKDSTLVRDTDVFNRELGGTGVLSLLIEAPAKGDILDPGFLHKVDLFDSYIRSGHKEVGAVQTIVPDIKRINRIMNYGQVPYGKRVEESADFDFFSNDISGETALPVVGEKKVAVSPSPEETVSLLEQAMADAGPDPTPEEIVKSFLAKANYKGAAFDEIPLDPAKYGLSDQSDLRNLITQYLVLYSGSLDMMINDSLEPDSTLITVQITNEDSRTLDGLIKDIRSYWNYYLPEGWTCSIGGGASISHALSSLVTRSQLLSLAGALLIVFLIVSLMFRSFTGGIIAMIPVFFAVLGIFLFMILFHFNLDIVTSLLAALAIGIGVDYAIHFINAWKRCRREKVPDVLKAVYGTTGRAIFINALSVAAGFLSLLISRFIPIRQLGILFSVSMIFASLSSLIVLPMVLERFQPGFLDK